MKNIFKLFSLIAVLLLTVVACEKETEWFKDYTGDGDVYVQFAGTEFDFGLFLDAAGDPVTPESFPIYVKLVGPAQSSDVTAGISVTESTGAAGEWSLASNTVTIPAGSLSGSVMITISKNNAALDSVYTIELALNESSSVPVYSNSAASASVTVMKGLSCALDYAMFDGDYYYETIWDYEPNPAAVVTPDADNDMLSISTTWDEMGPVVFTLDVEGEVATNVYGLSSDNQLDVWSGDLTSWGLSDDCDFNFEDFNGGGAESCTGVFYINCTPTLDDNGAGGSYWWGGEFTFTFHPGAPGKKAAVSVAPVGGFTPKLQRR